MLAYLRRVHVDRSPVATFRVLAAPELTAGWAPGVIRVEVVTPLPLRPGSVLREVRRLPVGQEIETELTVVDIDPPARYVVASTLGEVRTTWDYEVSEHQRGSTVVLTCRVEAPPEAARRARMLARVLKRQDRTLLKALRRTVESMP